MNVRRRRRRQRVSRCINRISIDRTEFTTRTRRQSFYIENAFWPKKNVEKKNISLIFRHKKKMSRPKRNASVSNDCFIIDMGGRYPKRITRLPGTCWYCYVYMLYILFYFRLVSWRRVHKNYSIRFGFSKKKNLFPVQNVVVTSGRGGWGRIKWNQVVIWVLNVNFYTNDLFTSN